MRAILYLIVKVGQNTVNFLRHWYLDSFLATSHFMLGVFESLDRTFALKINVRNIFEPLYQDRSFLGYILGFILRSVRVVVGSVVYLCIFAVSVALYGLWLLVPPFVIFKIVQIYG